jgi:hypothetical protein
MYKFAKKVEGFCGEVKRPNLLLGGGPKNRSSFPHLDRDCLHFATSTTQAWHGHMMIRYCLFVQNTQKLGGCLWTHITLAFVCMYRQMVL